MVHCPYCHGWEVRDEPIGILAVGPASQHQALLFRQLTDDVVYFTRDRFAARGIEVVDTPVTAIESEASTITGVRLVDGRLHLRRVLAVASTMHARLDGLDDLRLPLQDLPNGMGRHIVSGMAGTTTSRPLRTNGSESGA